MGGGGAGRLAIIILGQHIGQYRSVATRAMWNQDRAKAANGLVQQLKVDLKQKDFEIDCDRNKPFTIHSSVPYHITNTEVNFIQETKEMQNPSMFLE